ncbi:MAG TPA: alpha/beta hydrolase [Burkholderiales bacterium]
MRGLALVLAALLLGSCKLIELNRNVHESRTVGGVAGQVTHRERDSSSIVVFALREEGGGWVADNFARLATEQKFLLRLEAGKRYLIGAFADRNGDLLPDVGEPTALAPEPITVAQGWKGVTRVNLTLARSAFPASLTGALQGILTVDRKELPIAVGEVAALDDDRFSEESGEMGLWAALDFLTQVGIGVFFIEPYDPKRIPVLFVSGAGGNPYEWRTVVESLDRTRYQAWFFVYPSGQRLELSATVLQRCMQQLQKKYRFQKVYVTAHSMGGLVSRGYIQKSVQANEAGYLRLFVTLSTPWQGHKAAKSGVEYSPAVIPSWIDMQTDSEYQLAIFARPFQPPLSYYLLYSQTDPKAPVETATDGAVAVSSQLRKEAVRDARQVLGFTETHTSILTSSNVISAYQRILRETDK